MGVILSPITETKIFSLCVNRSHCNVNYAVRTLTIYQNESLLCKGHCIITHTNINGIYISKTQVYVYIYISVQHMQYENSLSTEHSWDVDPPKTSHTSTFQWYINITDFQMLFLFSFVFRLQSTVYTWHRQWNVFKISQRSTYRCSFHTPALISGTV